MIGDSIGAVVSDLIWILSSGHIGMARAMLRFLEGKFGSRKPAAASIHDAGEIEMELRSVELLQYIRSSYRGIPTAESLEQVIKAHVFHLVEEKKCASPLEMSEIMNAVASGKVVRSSSDHTAVELLTKFGFLYEDQDQQLQFASSMHLKIWLDSNRTDPIGSMGSESDVSHDDGDDVVMAGVKRMRASRLQQLATEANASHFARERQIQMELYHATVSWLPRDVLVTPEWRTDDVKGYMGLVIRGSNMIWFWELLVDGGDAVGQSKRFETRSKFDGRSLAGSSRYVLMDFRQNQNMDVRHLKRGFLNVVFVDFFTKARICGLSDFVVDVELSS